MWSVSTIITGLISFMAESSPTLGSIETSTNQKKKFARYSLENNVKDDKFVKLFPHLVTLHNEQMQKRKDLGERIGAGSNSHASVENDGNGNAGLMVGNGMQSILAVGTGLVALLSILFAMRFL